MEISPWSRKTVVKSVWKSVRTVLTLPDRQDKMTLSKRKKKREVGNGSKKEINLCKNPHAEYCVSRKRTKRNARICRMRKKTMVSTCVSVHAHSIPIFRKWKSRSIGGAKSKNWAETNDVSQIKNDQVFWFFTFCYLTLSLSFSFSVSLPRTGRSLSHRSPPSSHFPLCLPLPSSFSFTVRRNRWMNIIYLIFFSIYLLNRPGVNATKGFANGRFSLMPRSMGLDFTQHRENHLEMSGRLCRNVTQTGM